MPLFWRSTYPSVKLHDIATKCPKHGIEATPPSTATEFDYIIVGGGAAGCVLANRLSANLPNAKILLLERGQRADTFQSRTPLLSLGYQRTDDGVMTYDSAPQKHLSDSRKMKMIAGKLLGGTTRINNGLYSRCHPSEFDTWGEGWSFDELEPLYDRSERNVGKSDQNDKTGEWSTRVVNTFFPSSQIFLDTVKKMGVPFVEDINDPQQPTSSLTKLRTTVTADGKRCSAYEAFLPEHFVRSHSNLKICFGAVVQRLEVTSSGDSQQIEGVYVETEESSRDTFYVKVKEIILCAGAVASPQLLLLSGIGPTEDLSKIGVVTKVELPGVGRHLQDHISVPLCYKVPLTSSIHVLQSRPFTAIKSFIQYLLHGNGLFISPATEYTYFLRSDRYPPRPFSSAENDSRNPDNLPDLEFAWIGAWGTAEDAMPKTDKYGYNTLLVQVPRPQSKGTLTLVNRDARTPPLVDPNYLDSPKDLETLKKGIEYGLDIGRKMIATGYDMTEAFGPKDLSDDALDVFIRKVATGAYHLSSTCRMAKREDGGVVDQELRCYGVKGLRIADASIFPGLVGMKPQATIVMVGEKCAELILGRK